MRARAALLCLAALGPTAPVAAGGPFDALWGGLWTDNPTIGRVIVVAIFVLGLSGAHAALAHLRRYRLEDAQLALVRSNLAQWRSAQGTAEPPTEGREPASATGGVDAAAPNLVAFDRLREGLDGGGLIGSRMDLIEALRNERQSVETSLLQQLGAARDESRRGLATAGFAAANCMLLGILGTFAGLAIMVQQIDLGLPGGGATGADHDVFEQAFANLRSVLGGMKTAFSTSLVGMSWALVCTALDFRLRRRQAAFFERFERFTIQELLPATVPAYDDENLLERVSRQLEDSFGRLEEIQRLNHRTLEDLTGLQSGFGAMVEEIRTITRGEAARDLDRVIEELEKTNGSVVTVAEQVPRLIAAAERRGQEMLSRLELLASPPPLHGSPAGGGLFSPRTLLIALVAVAAFLLLTRF